MPTLRYAAPLVMVFLTAMPTGCGKKTKKPGRVKAVSSAIASSVFLTSSDVAKVCAGKKPPTGFAAYQKKAGVTSPVSIAFRESGTGKFAFKASSMFMPWGASSTKDVQLAACVTVTGKKKVRECSFKRLTKKQKDVPRTAIQYDTTYAISVRETATGKELSKTDVEVKAAAECPTIFSFKKDREPAYASFEGELLKLVMPLQGAGVKPPKLTRSVLSLACDGIGLMGAPKYTKSPGPSQPFAAVPKGS